MSRRGRDGPRDYPHAYVAPLCPSEYSRWGVKGALFYCSVSSLLVTTELLLLVIVSCVVFFLYSTGFGLTTIMCLCGM